MSFDNILKRGGVIKKLGEVYIRLKGTPITAQEMKKIANNSGNIRIFAGGKTTVLAFEKDIKKSNIINIPALLIQSRGIVDVIYCEEPFTFKNEMWAYTAKEKVSVKYLYYVLKKHMEYFRCKAVGMGSLPQISISDTENFQILIPPIEVQQEIVDILDKFESMCNSLTEGLPAEIEARKKQYEYYRDKLLSFEHN